MQITEEIVNSAALNMIDEVIGKKYSIPPNEDTHTLLYGMLCQVRGIIDMADCMKEVLNHERTTGTQEAL